ncbi:hypothetical protein [Litoreibacter roseus]|uniref:Uncharacterized protein n=1 Tax=Litoreibacter roseus TaxID=2601869 RepID=A0A6N6JGU6_9RHOB|nr:hypothetical protein [Litoreibacter roseus]GFE65541.1 hypothetical protein KIN_26150 [Litoreibacter roseus]
MSDKDPKLPSFDAFTVTEGKDDKSYFTKIGASFEHKDQQGHTIDLKALPIDNRIVLRTPRERLEENRKDDKPRRQRSDRDR